MIAYNPPRPAPWTWVWDATASSVYIVRQGKRYPFVGYATAWFPCYSAGWGMRIGYAWAAYYNLLDSLRETTQAADHARASLDQLIEEVAR